MLPLYLLCKLPWGYLGVTAKFGPLARRENCDGLRGLDDKLMTHFLSKIEEATGLLVVVLEAVVVVVLVVVTFVVVVVDVIVSGRSIVIWLNYIFGSG